MSALWQFHGGIHPPQNKHQSTARDIEPVALPQRLVLPLQQHIGSPAQTRVKAGDRVLRGQCLADAIGTLGVPVHAPTSGTIEAIDQHPVPHPSGMVDWCVILRPDGENRWQPRQPVADYQTLSPAQLQALIRNAGIAGLGGAGFPTHAKLGQTATSVSTLIINGAECEPYITADDMTMRERAHDVIAGVDIMARMLAPERRVIAVEDNKPEAIAALRQAAAGSTTEVVVIPTIYPSGGEKQLIRILTGREVPHRGLPAEIGVVCQNVGTAVAVARAVLHDEPLISRITTVSGEAVSNPGNFEVLLGTPISHLLAHAGLRPRNLARLVMGGPMMGYTLQSTDIPVTKTSNCVLAASATELPDPPPEQPCIRCGLCAEVCPMDLLPQQLFWHARADEFDSAEHLNLFDCIECGACSYVCPSSIPLVQYYRYAKGEIRTREQEQIRADRARERFEARRARLEREQAEKEARRRERARAAGEKARRQPRDQTDRKGGSALVQEALDRKQARQASASAGGDNTPAADTVALEKQLAQARAKLATMQGMLDEARSAGSDNVDKLERAVSKNQERVERAREALVQRHPEQSS